MGSIYNENSYLNNIAYVEQAGDPTTIAVRWLSYFKSGGMYQKSPAGTVLRLLTTADIPGSGAAPADATYITQTPNGTLSAEQALSLLATGLMQVTTATGVVSSVTTSAGLAGLISDETGTGALVFAGSPALTGNPTITGDGATLPILLLTNNDTGGAPGVAFIMQTSRNGAALQSGDNLFSLGGRGYGATGFGTSITGLIRGVAGENFTDTAKGTYLEFRTTPIGSASPAIRAYITAAGSIALKTASAVIVNDIGIGGNAARTIGQERNTTSNTSGGSQTFQSAGATSGATDKNAGDLIMAPGLSTGMGKSKVRVQRDTTATSTGTSDNSLVDGLYLPSPFILADNTTTSLIDIALPTLTSFNGQIRWGVVVTNGTDQQAFTGIVSLAAVNKAGVYTTTVTPTTGNEAKAVSSSTVTVTWTLLTGTNKVTIQVNVDSGLTPSTGFPQLYYIFENFSPQVPTYL